MKKFCKNVFVSMKEVLLRVRPSRDITRFLQNISDTCEVILSKRSSVTTGTTLRYCSVLLIFENS
jgi:hypothetical protein